MKQRIFCLGDIHGHFNTLMDLMEQLYRDENLDLSKDVLVTLGDMVDGGKDSKKVLDWAMDLKEKYPNNFINLLGNHETLLLDAFNPKHPVYGDFYLWKRQGGKATLDSFLPKDKEFTDYEIAIMQPKDLITEPYLNFIKSFQPYYETSDYFMVHAGVFPELTLEETKKAVEGITPETMQEGDMLFSVIWLRDEFIYSDYDWGKKIIFGHTSQPSGHPLIMENKICIDTAQLHIDHNKTPKESFSGNLTAIILPEEEFVYSQWRE